jgi:hypothetical protein
VDYIRLVDQGEFRTFQKFYQRAVPGADVHPVHGGVWIEGIAGDSTSDLVRSVDVLIAGGASYSQARTEVPVSVEILVVEIPGWNRPSGSARSEGAGSKQEE